jgi:hypothetical protein
LHTLYLLILPSVHRYRPYEAASSGINERTHANKNPIISPDVNAKTSMYTCALQAQKNRKADDIHVQSSTCHSQKFDRT